jgi:iron complex outermembrane recepter protein
MKLKFHIVLFGAASVFALATTTFAQTLAVGAPAASASAASTPTASATTANTTTASGPTASAPAADESLEAVVVTGSRVISDIANSPTPITTVTAEQLALTTPTDIADALNKLPDFFGSNSARTINNPSSNATGNTLNLRNFGSQRTLVLLDGDRLTPSNSNGTTDVDILPTLLVSRVDVVTGGASAVYGSDAITGVVNYVLDKNFNGVKYEANTGISDYGDAPLGTVGIAMGTDLFGGKGHIEGSLHFFDQGGVPQSSRPYASNGQAWILVGQGTTSNPYTYAQYGRQTAQGVGGLITCQCAANNLQFVAPGVLAPFNPGQPTPSGAGVSNGGDGGYDNVGDYQAQQRNQDAFVRFSEEINDTTSFYIQGTAALATDSAAFAPSMSVYPGGYGISTFYTNNPFLSPAARALVSSGNPGNTFNLTSITETLGGLNGGTAPNYTEKSKDRNLSVTLGLDGKLFDKYDWRLHYTHGDSRQEEYEPFNQNMQKMYAASDAVLNSAGNIVCYVSTTKYANLYPGCVPFNVFGEGSTTRQQYDYTHQLTDYVETNTLDNISGSIAGPIFDLPAGPVKAALSAEARWLSLDITSNSPATATVNCTGLRNCNPGIQLYDDNTVSPAKASDSVWEFAGEVNVPILANLPLVKDLSADFAGRVTDYSVSGLVETWKGGLDYHVNNSITFRGSVSQDIRAPTLTDLFQPLTVGGFGFSDPLTGVAGTLTLHSQGNSQLKPEVSRTYSGGFVLTPVFIPRLSLSVDYYQIQIGNAITAETGADPAVQSICTASGGTSNLCNLIVRPISPTNTSPANYPSYLVSEVVNAATVKTEGVDVELNYKFDLADIGGALPGSVTIKSLFAFQPYVKTTNLPGEEPSYAPSTTNSAASVAPHDRSTTFAQYDVGNWSLNVQNNWLSRFSQQSLGSQVFVNPGPWRPSFDTVDATITKKIEFEKGGHLNVYVSIQNIANANPPLVAETGGGFPGGFYPALPYESGIGRFYTVGIRGGW